MVTLKYKVWEWKYYEKDMFRTDKERLNGKLEDFRSLVRDKEEVNDISKETIEVSENNISCVIWNKICIIYKPIESNHFKKIYLSSFSIQPFCRFWFSVIFLFLLLTTTFVYDSWR